jgi:ketosteroid isomerase-like protein
VSTEDDVRRVVALMNQRIDDGDTDGVIDLLAADASVELVEVGATAAGPSAATALVETLRPGPLPSRHFTVNSLIEADGGIALVSSDFFVLTKLATGGGVTNVGRFEDYLGRKGRSWQFLRRRVVTGTWQPSGTDRMGGRGRTDDESVRLTLAQYNQFLKDRRLDDLVDLWTPTGVFTALGVDYVGRDEIRAFLAANAMPSGPNVAGGGHLVTNSMISLDGDVALCSSDMFTIQHADAGPVLRGSVGRYVDRLVRDANGRWRFAHRRNVTAQWP